MSGPTSRRVDREARYLALGMVGVVCLVGGLTWDAYLHARDPGLAGRESPFSFRNPGHVLLGWGIAMVVLGLVGSAHEHLKARGRLATARAGAWVLALSAVLASGAAASGTWAAASGHDSSHDAVVATAGGPPGLPDEVADVRLPATEQAALDTLAADGPSALAPHAHSAGHGRDPVAEVTLSEPDQIQFDRQWRAAQAAAARLATPALAKAAGYVQISPELAGVGAHWVRWSLIAQPFDPANPSMLLFDRTTRTRPPRLVGFSYWVRSPQPPEGFVGPNDHWHQHFGLCFRGGWAHGENIGARTGCAGDWLNGADLWMLHAWVVPDVQNHDGKFAPVNTALCPRPTEVPDALSCNPVGA